MSVAAARALVPAVVVLFVFSCTTVTVTPLPDWAQKPPSDTQDELYFVASGPSRREAAERLADEVVHTLSLGEEAELDSQPVRAFARDVAATAVGEPGARLEGFRVTERAVTRSEGETTHWLLGRYEREVFAEREVALAREVPGGNPTPHYVMTAAEQAARGDFAEALRSYGRAVVETADTSYASQTLRRVRPKVARLLERVVLRPEQSGVETRIGRSYQEGLVASITDRVTEAPVADMPVLVRYPERLGDGPIETESLFQRSEEDGRVRFFPPSPAVSGTGTVTMTLAPFYDLAMPRREPEELLELVELARAQSVSLEYGAFSLAAEIPTGVYVVDTDIAGNPTGSMATQRGLLGAFDRRGFSASALPLSAERFLSLAEPDKVSIVRQRFDGEYERVVFGTASITSFEESDSIAVEVGGELTAIELETGEELYRNRLIQRSRGNTASSAIAAAFRQLGAKFASDLARRLP
jgi:hypothetical protein